MAASIGKNLVNQKSFFSTFLRSREILTCYSWKHLSLMKRCDIQLSRPITTGLSLQAGGNRRKRLGQSRSNTEYGPLTDLPDWSYADGRPAPPTKGQMRRREEQRQLAMEIDKLAHEMMLAKKLQSDTLSEEIEELEQKSEQQLKMKGDQWKFDANVKNARKNKKEILIDSDEQ